MLFVALRYTSYVQHQQAEQKKKGSPKSEPPSENPSEGGGSAGGGNGGTMAAAERSGDLGNELLAGEGVSLG